ncbi:MAG: DUF998 domain-containing protein [Pseudomonadota bacterium]
MGARSRRLLRFAALATAITLLCHLFVLASSGQDVMRSPISALSTSEFGSLNALGIILFGIAHIAAATALRGLDHGRLWPVARLLMIASGCALFYVAYYFETADPSALVGPDANDPLWIVATMTGLAMGALQPGLSRLAPRVGLFSTISLGVWLWLVPIALFVNEHWLGAYERIVGVIYVFWLGGLTTGLELALRQRVEPT